MSTNTNIANLILYAVQTMQEDRFGEAIKQCARDMGSAAQEVLDGRRSSDALIEHMLDESEQDADPIAREVATYCCQMTMTAGDLACAVRTTEEATKRLLAVRAA